MNSFLFVLILVFMVVVLPVWIFFNFLAKIKTNGQLSAEEERTMVELWEYSQKMEQRIETLEVILDKEVPDWRQKK